MLPSNYPQTNKIHFPGLFIFGHGNVGKAICKNLLLSTIHTSLSDTQQSLSSSSYCFPTLKFTHIFASTRSMTPSVSESHLTNSTNSITYVSITDMDLLKACLSKCSHILITIPPILMNTEEFQSPPRTTSFFDKTFGYKDVILDSHIANFIPSTCWIGFVSTTGVYGNHDNEWVDETSDTLVLCNDNNNNNNLNKNKDSMRPNKGGITKAEAFLDLEQRWIKKITRTRRDDSLLEDDTTNHTISSLRIFRCAGIYGNHASALHTIIQSGFHSLEDANMKSYHVPTSRIHIDDVARAILLSMNQYNKDADMSSSSNRQDNYEVYNLADDEPASRYDVFTYASNLLLSQGWIHASSSENYKNNTSSISSTSERHQRRLQQSKRVMNKKMKNLLLGNEGRLIYKTYREGLLSILQYLVVHYNVTQDMS